MPTPAHRSSPARTQPPSDATALAEAPLPIAVVGCDFRVASAQWRNNVLLDAAERAALTGALRAACGAAGLVVLETCNRVEWLVTAPDPAWAGEVMRAQMIERWLSADPSLRRQRERLPSPYIRCGRAAVTHLLRVAVGLESFVVGEREIAGQLNRALAAARAAGHASPFHNALQTAVGRTVKRVQRLTAWRHHSRGVHSLALQVWQQHRTVHGLDGRRAKVACVGMGEIGRKVAQLFASHGHAEVLRFNRTPGTVGNGGNDWHPLESLSGMLAGCDAVVVATGARDGVAVLDAALHARPPRPTPLLAIDLGAPAQLRTVSRGSDAAVVYCGLDELLALPAVTPAADDASHVLELVEEGVREFVLEYRKRDSAHLLRAVHDVYERVAYVQLPQVVAASLQGQGAGDTPRRVEAAMRDLLREMTRELVQHIELEAASRDRHPHQRHDEQEPVEPAVADGAEA